MKRWFLLAPQWRSRSHLYCDVTVFRLHGCLAPVSPRGPWHKHDNTSTDRQTSLRSSSMCAQRLDGPAGWQGVGQAGGAYSMRGDRHREESYLGSRDGPPSSVASRGSSADSQQRKRHDTTCQPKATCRLGLADATDPSLCANQRKDAEVAVAGNGHDTPHLRDIRLCPPSV